MAEKKQKIYLVHEQDRGKTGRSAAVREFFAAIFLFAGILFSVWDLFYSVQAFIAAFASGVAVTLVLLLSNRISEKLGGRVRIAFYVAVLAVFLLMITSAATGFLDVSNRFITLWNARFLTEWRTFSISGNTYFAAIVFWIFAAAVLAALFTWLAHRKSTVGLMLLAIAGLLFAFVLGRTYLWASVIFLAASFCTNMNFSIAPVRCLHVRGIVVILTAVGVFAVIAGALAGYGGSARLTAWKATVRQQVREWRYGSDTLPQGDLRNASGLVGDGGERLEVEMETEQELYLGGFTGADYEGSSWKELDASCYEGEYAGLLEWLADENFIPQTQYASYRTLSRRESGESENTDSVSVTNIGAYRKYVYLPTTVDSWDAGRTKTKRDWQVLSKQFFGADSYSFEMEQDSPTADEVVSEEWLAEATDGDEGQYVDAESVYHAFVETYYMDVDEDMRSLITELFFSEDDGTETMDFDEITNRIRRVLRQETTYTEHPSNMPESEEDFVEWFLTEEKEGNAAAYASAAVLAYRAAGYPARYVEGYHYRDETDESEDAQADSELTSKDGSALTVTLTDQDAHAWCEVYVSGIGWLPVEVVPGMYTETYTDQIIEGTPSYEINRKQDENGLETESGDVIGEENTEEDSQETETGRHPLGLAMFLVYLIVFAWLIAELQRKTRGGRKEKSLLQKNHGERVESYSAELFLTLQLAGIQGDYHRPVELAAQVEEQIPAVRAQDYLKAVSLIQKVRFGGCELKPWEERIVQNFLLRLQRGMYEKSGRLRKIWLRYRYAL